MKIETENNPLTPLPVATQDSAQEVAQGKLS